MSIETAISPTSPMPSLKRPHPPDDEDTARPSTPVTDMQTSAVSSVLSSPANIDTPTDTPMASSTNATSTCNSPSKAPVQSSLPTTTQPANVTAQTQQSSSAPPTKRRKLTPAEKIQQEAEKALKAQERADAKARKEAEAKAKEDEKRKKAEEKELDKKQKDEEKKQKLHEKEEERRKKVEERELKQKLKNFEKQQKDEEKERRERSQMRLSSFFNLPKSSPPAPLSHGKGLNVGGSPLKHDLITKEEVHRRSMSLDPADFEPSTPTRSKPSSDSDKQAKQVDKGFLPFVLGKHMRLAPHNMFLPSDEDLVRVNEAMDSYAGRTQKPSSSAMESFVTLRTRRGFQPPKITHVIQQLQGSSNDPIDLTQDAASRPMDILKSIPLKYFFYGEDVRPPYRGTWTRPVGSRLARKLALRPLARELPDVDYNYDSEAEWEDADEGEDIEIEDNEEEEEEEEEMEGFIDDDNAPQYLARRGLPANDVEPNCSGIQWEDASGKLNSASPKYKDANFSEFSVCFLLDPSPKTIDPFTTAYWDPEPKHAVSTLSLASSMGPPRLPLQDRTNGQSTVQMTLVNGKIPKAAKVGPRLVPADVLPAFKAAVNGSDMTKIALIEALKKQFPKLRKDEITETLPLIAQRVGAKQTEKRWILLEDTKV